MGNARRKLIAGNWKMNGLRADGVALAADVAKAAGEYDCDILICPPFTLLHSIKDAIGGGALKLGAQDCHVADAGAHTGDISLPMLKDAGVEYVIIGHSERRTDHGESDADVKAKAEAIHAAGMIAVICIGETEGEREDGRTMDVIATQLDGSVPAGSTAANTVIAYEPVWAIGTGKTATPEDAQDVHARIRAHLKGAHEAAFVEGVRVLYGGSMKPGNAPELLAQADIDGGLIGGASLKAGDFLGIAEATRN